MLVVDPKSYAELRLHAVEAYPEECCGVLLGSFREGGPEKQSKAVSAVRCVNTRRDSSRNRYAIDPTELVCIQRQAREQGLEIVGFYHSHPDHPAQWSSTDLAEAYWVGCSYIITSVVKGKAAETRSFRLEGSWLDGPQMDNSRHEKKLAEDERKLVEEKVAVRPAEVA
jgi:proteasome lid subunit RPN8/RPN11